MAILGVVLGFVVLVKKGGITPLNALLYCGVLFAAIMVIAIINRNISRPGKFVGLLANILYFLVVLVCALFVTCGFFDIPKPLPELLNSLSRQPIRNDTTEPSREGAEATPAKVSGPPESLSEKRRNIRRFLELHVLPDASQTVTTIEVDSGPNASIRKALSSRVGSNPPSLADKQLIAAYSDFILENLEPKIEREVPNDVIKEVVEFDATPEGKRMNQGLRKVARSLSLGDADVEKIATEIGNRIVQGTATEDDLLKLTKPTMPSYMETLFAANTFLLSTSKADNYGWLDKGSDSEKAMQRNLTLIKNLRIERFSKRIEEEFTIDEIRLHIRFIEEHPAMRELFTRLPKLIEDSMKNPDAIAHAKLQQRLSKIPGL